MGDNNNYNYAYETEYGLCPSWALSLGYLGVASGAVLSNWGSAVSSFFMSVKKLFVGTILLCVCALFVNNTKGFGYNMLQDGVLISEIKILWQGAYMGGYHTQTNTSLH